LCGAVPSIIGGTAMIYLIAWLYGLLMQRKAAIKNRPGFDVSR